MLTVVIVTAMALFACKNGGKYSKTAELSDTISVESSTSSSAFDPAEIVGTWKTKSPVLGTDGGNITVTFDEEDVTLTMNIRKSIGGIGSCSTTVTVPGTYSLTENQEIAWEFYPEEAEMGNLNASFTEDAKDEIYFTPGTEGSYRARLRSKVMDEVTKIVNTCQDISPLPLKKITAKKLIFEGVEKDFIFSRIED